MEPMTADPQPKTEEPRCRCLFRWSDHLMFTKPVEVVPGCPDHKPEDAQ
jgi:hypothetical protein